MAHETAARWCEKKDWGDHRCAAEAVLGGVVPLRVLGRLFQHMRWRRRITSGVRAPVVSDARRCVMLPFGSVVVLFILY